MNKVCMRYKINQQLRDSSVWALFNLTMDNKILTDLWSGWWTEWVSHNKWLKNKRAMEEVLKNSKDQSAVCIQRTKTKLLQQKPTEKEGPCVQCVLKPLCARSLELHLSAPSNLLSFHKNFGDWPCGLSLLCRFFFLLMLMVITLPFTPPLSMFFRSLRHSHPSKSNVKGKLIYEWSNGGTLPWECPHRLAKAFLFLFFLLKSPPVLPIAAALTGTIEATAQVETSDLWGFSHQRLVVGCEWFWKQSDQLCR